jgi:MFS family permease
MTTAPLLPPTPRQKSNFRALYGDVFGYGILAGSTLAFLNVYATRLGASAYQLAMLTALPGLVNLGLSLPSARWLEGQSVTRATFTTAIWNRLLLLPLVALPWLLPEPVQIWATIAIVLAYSIPGTVIAIAFNAMFADVVPPEWRGQVVGRRNAIMAIVTAAAALLSGQILDRVVFPVNYGYVFALGAVGGSLSTYFLSRVKLEAREPPPTRVAQPLLDQARPGTLRFGDAFRPGGALRFLLRARGHALLRFSILRTAFAPLLFAYFAFYTVQYFPSPLFPILWVRELALSDGLISLGSTLFYLCMLLASVVFSRLTARYGHHQVLVSGALLYSLYPLILSYSRGVAPFLVASALGGAALAWVSGGLVSHLMERAPQDDRPTAMAFHNLALNMGILIGPLMSPILAEWTGLRMAVLLAGGLRLVGGLLLLRWG